MRPSTRPSGSENDGRWRQAGLVGLGIALVIAGLRRRSVVGAAIAVLGSWLTYRAIRGSDGESGGDRAESRTDDEEAMVVRRSITVGAPAGDLAGYFQDASQLDRVLGDAIEVTGAGDDAHEWTVRGPGGRALSWKTRIVEDRPDERLRWTARNGSWLAVDGAVSFEPAPADRGTEVTLELRADPPGGRLGARALEQVGIVPASLVGRALDRLKSLAETGEIQTLDRNPSARGAGDRV